MEIAIVGGGIGGLSAAIALRRRGLAAQVYEAAPELREVGAGIWVPPNAMQVYARLDLARAIVREGAPVRAVDVADARAGLLMRTDLSFAERALGDPTIAIHRGRLQRVLADEVGAGAIRLGMRCTGVEERAGRVLARFDGGCEVEADVLVGADGLRSAVRASILPGVSPRYSGQTSYRATVQYVLPSHLDAVGTEIWSAGARFGFSAIGHGEVYWYAAADAPPGAVDPPGTVGGRLRALAEAFPSPVPELVAATDPSRITRTDLVDFAPIGSWHRGRVVLLGDAAHATTPNLGQGGAQAVEDAWVLADRLAAEPAVEEAFAAYERIRMPKAHHVTTMSLRFGRMMHLRNPLARAVRNLLVRATPAAVSRRQSDRLFRLNF